MAEKKKGRGILKALGEKKATGNFKKIEKAKGKGAAIGALQNKLAKRRGEKIPYGGKKKKESKHEKKESKAYEKKEEASIRAPHAKRLG